MSDNLVELEVGTIQGGAAVNAVNELIAKVAKDVLARPNVVEARTVTLKIKIAPELDGESGKNYPSITWDAKDTVPGKKGLTTKAIVEDGALRVSTVENNARQGTLPFRSPGAVAQEGAET